MDELLLRIRADLQAQSNQQTKAAGDRYFKQPVLAYGVKSSQVNAISKSYLKEIKTAKLSKAEILALCSALWASGYQEEAFVACNFTESLRKVYSPDDFDLFANWVADHVDNWAKCDTLCNHSVGDLLMAYPDLAERLLDWAKADNLWQKRAAAVSLIIPLRRGLFQSLAFQIALILLEDPEDLVQKGYGWMLKAASEHSEQSLGEVFDFVMANKDRMPRTALRYAIEKMPDELKKQAMAR